MNGIVTHLINYFNQQQIGKENVLDPLSTIIKLAILGYKSEYTKIAIRYNAIYLQETSFYQSTIRYLFGDSKDILHCLKEPITIACNYYLHDYDSGDHDITLLFKLAVKGIQKLKTTYVTHKIIISCLEYYELIISSYLERNDLQDTFRLEKAREDYSEKLITSMLNSWSENDIGIIIGLFDNLEKNEKYNLIKVIETFMVSVDASINHIIINSA
jgi:hypothetical protein